MALFRGEKASDVSTAFGICRSDLYKFRKRALEAMYCALGDHPRGPKRPPNRLSAEKEQKVVALCQRHPTRSSYDVMEKLGPESPCARTIQRVRKRNGIACLPKRAPPSAFGRRIPKHSMHRARHILKLRPHLGPERVVWDVQNGEHLTTSTSTVTNRVIILWLCAILDESRR